MVFYGLGKSCGICLKLEAPCLPKAKSPQNSMRPMAAGANWIAGTVELSSKVRYGLTSRGVPLFRFIPYDKRLAPFAVGCSCRDLFYNIHAIAEPLPVADAKSKSMPRASIVQTLGAPSMTTEMAMLIATYAHDSRKELRKFPAQLFDEPVRKPRLTYPHPTFHIDPPGCRDVDDTFSFVAHTDGTWEVGIHIADVASVIPEGSPLDLHAASLSTSFYDPNGRVVQSMLPPDLSESSSSLLPSDPPQPKPTLSLFFSFDGKAVTDIHWMRTLTTTTLSYTYDEASRSPPYVLPALATTLGSKADDTHDAHKWVERMMIFYNEQAAILLASRHAGILRRHSPPAAAKLKALLAIPGVPDFLAYQAAEYCLSTDADTTHYGLERAVYAYASSPLRRYADLVNQRAIHAILDDIDPPRQNPTLIAELNRRQRQAKDFSRDLFFISILKGGDTVSEGTVVTAPTKDLLIWKTKVWVPAWQRTITARSTEPPTIAAGAAVSITWYYRHDAPNWKERMVFQLK